MVYYIVHGWILPSEMAEEINAEPDQHGTSDSHEEGVRERGENKSEGKRVPELDDLSFRAKPRITWRINEKPSQEKMEDFLMEILELTKEGRCCSEREINHWSQYCTSI